MVKFFKSIKEILDLLPDDVIFVLKHGAAVGCGIIVTGTIGDVATHYIHKPDLLKIIEGTDEFVLVALVVGLGIEFVAKLSKRVYNSLFHSWVLLA